MLKLVDGYTKENSSRVDYEYDEVGKQFVRSKAGEEDRQPAGVVSFWLRPLQGRDQQAIADIAVTQPRKGDGKVLGGTVQREKVVRSVVACEGLEGSGGREVTKVTYEVYDRMPGWLCDALLLDCNDLSGDAAERLGE